MLESTRIILKPDFKPSKFCNSGRNTLFAEKFEKLQCCTLGKNTFETWELCKEFILQKGCLSQIAAIDEAAIQHFDTEKLEKYIDCNEFDPDKMSISAAKKLCRWVLALYDLSK